MIYIGIDPGKNGGIAVICYENKQEQNKRKIDVFLSEVQENSFFHFCGVTSS